MNPVGYLKTGIIHCDDNLRLLAQMPADCVDLIYLDPPFFSNRNYEVIWGDEAEVRSFEDRWEGGINVYVNWMRERMMELHRVLSPTGSLYLHCDHHASHYLKVMMDGIFGMPNLRNELVWHYASGGRGQKQYPRKHDILFLYTKGKDWTFNADAVGVRRDACQLCDTPLEKWNNLKKHVDDDGRVYRSIKSAGRSYRYYDDEPVLPTDVWLGINHLHQKDPERVGYPTQKPEALLERVIKASSNPGDIVLDPFCGCGTAIAVAHRLGRQWIGMDISPTAVGVMQLRLEKQGAQVDLVGLPVTEDDLRALRPFEFQNWVIQRVHGTHSPRKSGDMGVDGYSFMEHLPIQVKQSDKVGRNVVDNFETAVERSGKGKGYIVAFSFTRNAREEVARAKAEKGMEIELVEVGTLLEGRPDRVTPQLARLFPELPKSFMDLPLPAARSKQARPTVEELVESDRLLSFDDDD